MLDENLLLGENHATHAIGGAGHALAVKFADIFVAVRAVYAPVVAVQPKVECGAMLDNRLVERLQEYVRVVVALA